MSVSIMNAKDDMTVFKKTSLLVRKETSSGFTDTGSNHARSKFAACRRLLPPLNRWRIIATWIHVLFQLEALRQLLARCSILRGVMCSCRFVFKNKISAIFFTLGLILSCLAGPTFHSITLFFMLDPTKCWQSHPMTCAVLIFITKLPLLALPLLGAVGTKNMYFSECVCS